MKLYEIVKTKKPFSKQQFKDELATLGNPEPTHQNELLKQNPPDKESISEIVSTLKKECSEVIKIYKKVNGNDKNPTKLMYRGETSDVTFFKNSIWVKRRPKYLDEFTQAASVKAFSNLGLKANRENSIFCGRFKIASHWGTDTYVIFPVDGFDVTWFDSKDVGEYMFDKLANAVEDFVSDIAADKFPNFEEDDNVRDKYSDYYNKILINLNNKNSSLKKDFEIYVTKIIKEYNPISNELERALNTTYNNEYLVTGNAYYGVQVSYILENKKDFFQQLFNDV